jgi:DNA-directed RNA polymerase specialized sigma24 family protein
MAAATAEVLFQQLKTYEPMSRAQEQSDQFSNRFWRCQTTLHFIADLILGDSAMADDAVRNCWIRTSRSSPSIESEGAFRSWIMRVLISEALSILHRCPTRTPEAIAPDFGEM